MSHLILSILQIQNLSLIACLLDCQTTMEHINNLASSISCFVAVLAFVFSFFTYRGQLKVNKLQMMESTFFNMIELHQSIKNSLSFACSQPTKSPIDSKGDFEDRKVSGPDVFKFFWEEYWFKDKYTNEDGCCKINLDYKKGKRGMVSVLISLGSRAYQDYRELYRFKTYFSQLYETILFIDTRDFLDVKQKEEYAKQVRSILSPYELIWIYYDCLFGQSNATLKPLVERYALLKYIPRESLATTKDIMKSGLFKKDKTTNDYQYYITNREDCKEKFCVSAFED